MARKIESIDRNMAVRDEAKGVHWYDARQLPIEGQAWSGSDLDHWSDRLPAHLRQTVGEPVWFLSQHSAGLCLRFETDSTRIAARWSVRFDDIAMQHMPATGVSGLDLYVRSEGQWRWAAAGRGSGKLDSEEVIFTQPAKTKREYLLYFPLYNGIKELSVGVDTDAQIAVTPPRPIDHKPLLFYGTSIVQGGCASRPGMAYPALLGRWHDCESINLGFSGNGSMRPQILPALAEVKPSILVVDCLPNMTPELVTENAESFITELRKPHSDIPIVIVESIVYQITLPGGVQTYHAAKNAELRKAYDRVVKRDGERNLHYLRGDDLLGNDWEATVDGTHPTDLGFHRMAQAMSPIIGKLLSGR